MPEVNITTFNLENKSPPELEARRREIILTMQTKFKGYDDPSIPLETLQELAAVTSYLRRKNAGPPKAAKSASKKSVATTDDLLI